MIHTGDCVKVMAGMEAASVDAIVTDPPYGLEFMGKEWDRLDWRDGGGFSKPGIGERATPWASYGRETANPTCATCGGRARGARKCSCEEPDWRVKGEPMQSRSAERANGMQRFHAAWATEAFRVAKPGAYLLAFGGTRTYHRMTCAIEDAGWIIRDCLMWGYASGFPKGKANLKPAWEPIVMARKPGPLRPLAIDECRIGPPPPSVPQPAFNSPTGRTYGMKTGEGRNGEMSEASGRWPANVILTDPILDGDTPGVVGGGRASDGGDSGTYSRFFLIAKASRSEREKGLSAENGERANHHPTVKPLDLMRHLVRLVTPAGGVVLDPFLGSGTTALAAEMEGFVWVGIEREPEYVAIAEARLNGVQTGMGL